MGYLYRDTCHATEPAAVASACSTFPRVTTEGADSWTWTCTPSTGTTVVLAVQPASSAASSSYTQALAFQPCDPTANYADVSALWLLGLGLLAALAAFRRAILTPLWSNQ